MTKFYYIRCSDFVCVFTLFKLKFNLTFVYVCLPDVCVRTNLITKPRITSTTCVCCDLLRFRLSIL